jgi:hypothetical protein
MSLNDVSDWIFLQPAEVSVTAATIGIHRSRWSCVSSVERSQEAFKEMKDQRFDVLAIDPGEPHPVTEFFVTREWGQWADEKAIERREISHCDVIDYRTPFFEVIRLMATGGGPNEERRRFYFLGMHGDVVGLISAAHLNSRDAKIAVNAIVVVLEDQLSDFVSHRVRDEEQLKRYFDEEERKEFDEARQNNDDLQIVEHFYLKHLFAVIRKEGLYKDLKYESGNQFDRVNALVELRNTAMHAVRPLINVKRDVARLHELIERAKDLSFRLSQYGRRVRIALGGGGKQAGVLG